MAMRILLTEVVGRSQGGEARRNRVVEGSSLRIGRSATCEIHIADPRVLLHQATLEQRAGGIALVAAPEGGVLVNDRFAEVALLAPGDRVEFGPYRLTVREAPAGHDLALKLVQVSGQEEDADTIGARSRTSFGHGLFGKRAISYALVALVLVFCLALPLTAGLFRGGAGEAAAPAAQSWPATADTVWNTGPLSGNHRFLAEACSSCHQKPFVQVQDGACLSCHRSVGQHADPKRAAGADLSGQACQSCHKEHATTRSVVISDQKFCTACHADLTRTGADAAIQNVRDFGTAHPEFRVAIPIEAAAGGGARRLERVSLAAAPRPQDRSGLKFPHDRHLKANLRHPEKGPVQLACGNCHQPDSGGKAMQPVRFEAQCHECHALRFDAQQPDREMPHGAPQQAQATVRDFYAAQALRGAVTDASAPEVTRRRPGQVLSEPERLAALAWAERKADEVLNGKFGRGLCGECHQLNAAETRGLAIVPPQVPRRWLPHAEFTHHQHRDMGCTDCHAAPQSQAATDILLPGIATCRSCHGGETAGNKVASGCITCHQFHRADLPPLRAAADAPGPMPRGAGAAR